MFLLRRKYIFLVGVNRLNKIKQKGSIRKIIWGRSNEAQDIDDIIDWNWSLELFLQRYTKTNECGSRTLSTDPILKSGNTTWQRKLKKEQIFSKDYCVLKICLQELTIEIRIKICAMNVYCHLYSLFNHLATSFNSEN